jgi:hypothetical protein
MVALFVHTVNRSMRQARINIQNTIVFTVEFTRTPLSRRGKYVRTFVSAYTLIGRARLLISHRKFTRPGGRHGDLSARESSIIDCTPKLGKRVGFSAIGRTRV